jgi:hypothetical protein
MDRLQPTDEYKSLWEEKKKELRGFGLEAI